MITPVAIFQPEISILEAEMTELLAAVEARKKRMAHLSEAEIVASGIFQAVQNGIERFSALAPDAIARLKSRVLNLFGTDGDSNDGGNLDLPDGGDGGNKPNPTPSPEPLTGQFCEIDTDAYWTTAQPDGSAWEVATHLACLLEDAPASSLRGHAVDWACPLGDAPSSSLLVQSVEIACLLEDAPKTEENFEQLASDFQKEVQARGIQTICSSDGMPKFDLIWTRWSDRVATFSSPENPYAWEHGFVTYLGFPKKEVAETWQQHLLKIGVANKAIIRKVNRLRVDCPKGCAIRWELKVHGLSSHQLQHILGFDLTQLPPAEQKAKTADFEVCDRVRILQTSGSRNDKRVGGYGIVQRVDRDINMIEVLADRDKFGTLLLKPEWVVLLDATQFPACCNLPEPELMAALGKFHTGDRVKVVESGHPDNGEIGTVKRLVMVDGLVAVGLDSTSVERLYPPHLIEIFKPARIDINDVPAGVVLRETQDDLLTEYSVWVWVIAREKGVSIPKQACLGTIREAIDGIESYKASGKTGVYQSTTDAVVEGLINKSDWRLSDIEAALEIIEQQLKTTRDAVCEEIENYTYDPDSEDKEIREWLENAKYLDEQPEVLAVGEEVEVKSDRHGAELVGQVGKVTQTTAVGAAVDFGNGTIRWYCTDEVAVLQF